MCERGLHFYEDVKVFFGKDGMVIVQKVAGCLFNVNMEYFDSVYMCSFFC